MIRSLTVTDFQRHKKLKLRLDPHVTTIVGATNQGKSALLRALLWVLLNKPRGAKFTRHGCKRTAATVRVGRRKVSRSRGKANSYHLDSRQFNAFGSDVPEEIAKLLKVTSLNFQVQHDSKQDPTLSPLFWFSMAPGEVSRHLNAIVDLSLIDTTLSNLSTSQRRAANVKGVVEDRLKGARREIRLLLPVEEADKALRRVEALARRVSREALRCDRLDDLLRQAGKARADRRARVGAPAMLRDVRKLERLTGRANAYGTVEKKLTRWFDQYHETTEEQVELLVVKGEAEEELHSLMGETCPLCQQAIPS